VQDNDLFTQRLPDDEQRFHQCRQVGEVLDKLLDAGLKSMALACRVEEPSKASKTEVGRERDSPTLGCV
jgi:hypothetical protein